MKTKNKVQVSAGTIIRTIVLALALANQVLTSLGYSPLPVDNEQLTQGLTAAFTFAAAVWAWWKNNSFTQAALTADGLKDTLRKTGVDGVTVELTKDAEAAKG